MASPPWRQRGGNSGGAHSYRGGYEDSEEGYGGGRWSTSGRWNTPPPPPPAAVSSYKADDSYGGRPTRKYGNSTTFPPPPPPVPQEVPPSRGGSSGSRSPSESKSAATGAVSRVLAAADQRWGGRGSSQWGRLQRAEERSDWADGKGHSSKPARGDPYDTGGYDSWTRGGEETHPWATPKEPAPRPHWGKLWEAKGGQQAGWREGPAEEEDDGRWHGVQWRKERREEEKEWQRAEEQRRQREEEERAAAEEKRREEETRRTAEEKKKEAEEQSAAVEVRKIFTKLSICTPEAHEPTKVELGQVLEKRWSALGSMQQTMHDEAAKALANAKKRIEGIQAKRKEAEVQKREAEEKAKEQKEELERALSELVDLVDVAEAKTDLLKEALEKMSHEDITAEDLGPHLINVDEQGEDAEAAHTACQDFMKSSGLGSFNPELKALATVKAELEKLVARFNESLNAAKSLLKDAVEQKAKIVKRIAAKRKFEKEDLLFQRYDSDGDGHWSRGEVAAYAKSEFGVDLESEVMDRFFDFSVPSNEPGVPRARLPHVRAAVGIARDMVKQQKLRASREEAAAKVEEKRVVLNQKIADITGDSPIAFGGVEREFEKVEEKVKTLATIGKEEVGPELDATLDLIHQVELFSKEVQEKVVHLQESIAQVDPKSVVPELAAYCSVEAKKLTSRLNGLKGRSDRLVRLVGNSKAIVAKAVDVEAEKLRKQVVGPLQEYMHQHELTTEALFSKVDADGDGSLDEAEFMDFMRRECKTELSEEQLRLFHRHLGGGVERESKPREADLLRLLTTHYKVVEQTVITSGLNIKTGKALRRLQVGETIEVYEGPVMEAEAKVQRVRGKAVTDGKIGWVSVAGNQGTAYLEEVSSPAPGEAPPTAAA